MNEKIKLSLLGTLVVGSALAVTLPIGSCSTSTNNALLVDKTSPERPTSIAQDILKGIIGVAITSAEQIEIAKTWTIGPEVSLDLSNAIKKALAFTTSSNDKITGDLVVEKITYLSESTIRSKGEVMLGPKLDISLKSEHTTSHQLFLEPGQIGIVK